LLVTERRGRKPKDMKHVDFWKVPGGSVDDPNEHIGAGAIREVFEETGVKSEFIGIMGMRHMFGFRFGKSDFYYLCLLKSTSRKINKDPHEIEKCQWFDLEEFYKMDHLNYVQSVIRDTVHEYMRRNDEEKKKMLFTQFNVGFSPKHSAVFYHIIDLPQIALEQDFVNAKLHKDDPSNMYCYLGKKENGEFA